MKSINLKKFFLYLLIGSVLINALLGIGVILLGNSGEIETKILLTTLAITFVSLLGLACGVCVETKRQKYLPFTGICLSVISGILWIIMIWSGNNPNEFFIKLMMSTTILAVATTHLSLISLARLDQKFKWAIYATFVSVTSLVAILLGLIWATNSFESEFIFRLLGVLAIITSAFTIIVPIFHKLSDNLNEADSIDAEIEKLESRISELKARKEKL